MRIESTHLVNIKELCGAAWSSKELKVMGGNFACPLNAPRKNTLKSAPDGKLVHQPWLLIGPDPV